MPEFMKAADLKAAGIAFSPTHLLTLEGEGKFPKRVQLGTRKSVWLRNEIEAWVAEKVAASRGK